jgi:BON domain
VGLIVLVVALAGVSGGTMAYGSRSGRGAEYPSTWMYPPSAAGGWNYPPYWWSFRSRDLGFRGRGPRGYQRSDAQIRDVICERMADHPALDASDVDVMVAADGIVTLQGTVGSRQARRLAEEIADSVTGVRDVHNQLRLASEAGVRETPRRVA